MAGIETQHPSLPDHLLDKRITQMFRVLYTPGAQDDIEDGPLEIHLGEEVLLLDGAPDGDTLRLRTTPWQDPFRDPLSLEQEAYVAQVGRWSLVDVSHHALYAEMLGRSIIAVSLLLNQWKRAAGVHIDTGSRGLWFVVSADECHVHWQQPDGFFLASTRRTKRRGA